jgi:hypothetical protein
MICDEDGYAITDGLSSLEVIRTARILANKRGESVYYHDHWRDPDDDNGGRLSGESIEVKPDC